MSAGIANKLNVNPLTAPLQCAQVLKIYDDTMSLIRLLGLCFALGEVPLGLKYNVHGVYYTNFVNFFTHGL